MREFYYENIFTGELKSGQAAIKEYYSTPRKPLDAWTDEWHETRIAIPKNEIEPLTNPTNLFINSVRI